ncbi:6-phosphogluconolactonase [Spiroplasma taiwanense]|uniref:6-phosphogluconolactonase n=1 Tax=Spiroplasma taiwanense TaxID=2145 RepID=UPI0004276288|nr:6-phosphogluconolactonase [Spiroplasma taiwanense]
MNLIVKNDYEEMSEYTAKILYDILITNEPLNIALTGGKTPIRAYEILAEMLKNKKIVNKKIYNFDEIEYKNSEIKFGATKNELRQIILDKIDLSQSSFIHLNTKNYEQWNDIVKSNGGLDIIFIGLGADGHFCGNLSGEVEFGSKIRLIKIPQN